LSTILALDPGPKQTGLVCFDGRRVLRAGVVENAPLLANIADGFHGVDVNVLAIEKIEAMGMAVGADVFETVHWSGRFYQAWPGTRVVRITRRQVKLHLCGNMRAKDPNIRQALIDLLGEPGTKKQPGPTYGVTSHAWAALAVAVTAWHEMQQAREAA
jgi:Holliday junction resolvasome RuvABC endonuclease subunit